MPLEPREVSEVVAEENLGSLRGCLVEGDPEQRIRERRVRRRALVISIVIQTGVLALLVVLPLFGKSGHIALAIATPIPPYSPYKGTPHDRGAQHPHGQQHNVCHFCAPPAIPPIIVTHDSGPPESGVDETFEGLGLGIPGAPSYDLIPVPGSRLGPRPPVEDNHHVARPSILHVTRLAPAMLIHRVEPVYPTLAKQTHKEGRVEVRAIIGTDGRIQSLQVVSGDVLFVQSALEAVQQWRYKPTILNGQPVEIDTYITVIYTMPH